ncbi:hypothetical protein DUI87_34425 [Hirundo rustica rustica]|uniref:Uncharacterized protein n=1 Tax=Hirundo rustica rustica TaxID=333673 RepID=A0A3M0IQK6_HIRRU|nr:hypothetical protein DUI87_34425 [Hirundo rustica rustica]
MALALRLILLLLLAVALPARTAQAAPWRAQGAVKPEGEDDLDSQPTSKTETLGDAEVKPEGEGDLDSQPTSKTETLGDAEDWYRDMDYLEMLANGGLKQGQS